MRKFFTGSGILSDGSPQSFLGTTMPALRVGRRRRGKRHGMSKRAHKVRLHATAALMWIPFAWGLCFGIAFALSRDGFPAPYDWMKAVAMPIADALAPFFPGD